MSDPSLPDTQQDKDAPPQRPPRKYRLFSKTDVGRRRQRNEDSLGHVARFGVFAVADGMGGVDGGDLASAHTIQCILDIFSDMTPGSLDLESKLDLVTEAVSRANDWILRKADENGVKGMGTTVAILVFDDEDREKAAVLHAGDSRVYRMRNRDLHPLTKDHSLTAEAGLTDNDYVPMFMAGVITRAVGVKPELELERTDFYVKPNDVFMLCTDGLYNMLKRRELAAVLHKHPLDPVAALVDAANDAGGFDNIGVVVVEPTF